MIDLTQLKQQGWYYYLGNEAKLIELAITLYERELESSQALFDYSFVVFPMAKAYEGFLKKYFFDMGVIDQKLMESRRFRIGRALNPDVRMNQRDENWVYDDLVVQCGEQVARELWTTWLEGRNRLFHFFPKHYQPLSLEEAGHKLAIISDSIDRAFSCKISVSEHSIAEQPNSV